MKKTYPSIAKQLMILGIQSMSLVFCAQPAICAGPAYIPGYYGSAAAVLPPPAATALPSGATVIDGINTITSSGSTMNVHQGKPRAVIHWQNFDIGSQASVHFDQQDSSWKALNRVTGDGYSQIFGSLTAKGQVYLLNQNGILFGAGSQINVHSLTASALNLNDTDFLNLPDFSQGGKEIYTYFSSSPLDATVANHGTITAGDLGSVFLIGPQVENNGTITARGGDVGLFAGEQVEISQDQFANFTPKVTGGTTSGTVTNFAVTKDSDGKEIGGKIITEKGWTGMYGSVVNQDGLIRAVTALEKNGRIELQATNRVKLGATSQTEVLMSDLGERKVVDADTFKNSEIKISATEGTIEHYGRISAPGGDVSLTARDRVFLEAGSSIDVAGSWVGLTAADRTIEVQLNSQELRDAFAYKNGPLKGQKVQVDVITGLSVADISGYLDSMEKSAPEMTTKGGTIGLTATGDNGEVIVKQGASLDVSGGGLIYGEGFIQATKVRIGNKLYDLQDVPADVPIDEVLGSFSKEHTRYGKIDEWQGLWYGGSSPYLTYLPSFIQGADGGMLNISSRKIILDGSLNASVLRGIYQNSLEDPTDQYGYLTAIGRRVPCAGTLQISDVSMAGLTDLMPDALVIKNEVTAATIAGQEPLPDQNDPIRVSELSAATLNAAGLGTLKLYANTTIKVEENVNLILAELGKVDFKVQNIEHRGSIRIPSGTVDFTLKGFDPNSSGTIPDVKDRLFLAAGSTLDVSGQRLDNSALDFGNPLQFGFTHGGAVKLIDDNDQNDGEVILAGNSLINVSGGYMISGDRSITGGKAGSLTLMGNTVRPDGRLVGLALEGSEGGTLSIHADEVTVTTSAPSLPYDFDGVDELPENLQHHLFLADNRFVNTGFSHITLKSEGDLLVENGVRLAPSSARMAEPLLTTTGYRLEESATVTARPEYFGASSLTLAAGQKIYTDRAGTATIEEAASLFAAPVDGTISLEGDKVILAGSLTAWGGDIKVTANNGEVVLTSTATVDVSGTSLPDLENSLSGQALNHFVMNGGSVDLKAAGDVVLEAGSRIDVSGSEAVTNLQFDQRRHIIETTTASAAGSVNIEYQNDFTSDGELLGRTQLSWLPGGSLAVAKTRMDSDAAGHTSTLTVQEDTVTGWQKGGFDDFTFSSLRTINFAESALDNDEIVTIAANRALVLNAAKIDSSPGQTINLSAPWLRLTNIVLGTDKDSGGKRIFDTVEKGSAHLTLSGGFIDFQGNVALSGFAETTMHSTNDLRLYDYYYTIPQKGWSGALQTAGDLSLQAAAIYPGMHHSMSSEDNTHTIYPSSFTITAGMTAADGSIKPGEGNKITILAPEQPGHQDISSAGGKLTLLAGDIEHHGVLAAPMGEIVLTAENSIVLGEGSTLSTRGEAMTLYGKLEDDKWVVGGYRQDAKYITDKTPAKDITSSPELPVTAAPEKSVRIAAEVITQAPDAVIDVSGGGSIFSYQFLPGYDGSSNPLGKVISYNNSSNPVGKGNRYVILPDNSIILPGKTIYLEGMEGLKEGSYSLLPAEYAFLPGAMIIEDSGKTILPGTKEVTPAGYTMIAGSIGDRAINTVSPLRSGYIIRDAHEVLAEGKFDTWQSVAGNAGQVQISAGSGTSTLTGSILGGAMAGYSGGSLLLGAEDLFVGLTASLTGEDKNYNLIFDIDKIRNKGLRLLQLGDDKTKTVTIGAGTTLEDIAQVDMQAAESITLQQGAKIYAKSDAADINGALTLTTNTLYGEDNTILHASDALTFNIDNLKAYTFAGTIGVDSGGTFQANSSVFYLEPASYSGARKNDPGFHLTPALVDAFKSIDRVILTSRSDMISLGNVNIAAKGDLTLDSARFTVDNSETTDPEGGLPMVSPYTVNISAGGTLRLQNSNAKSSQDDPFNGNTINLTAATVAFGPGDLNFDTFKGVHFASSGETIFNGTGSLNAGLAEKGALTFSASRYLSSLTPKSTTNADGSEFLSFELSDFTIGSGFGDIVMAGNGLGEAFNMAMPGSLTVKGENIKLKDALFNMPGGIIDFQASQDIIAENSSILAAGERLNFPVTVGGATYNNTVSLAGGQVAMQSKEGEINIDGSTSIDTSAEAGQEGGTIILSAPKKGVILIGKVKGDKIAVDTNAIVDFGALSRTIAVGGFSKQVDLQARSGDVHIAYPDTVTTDHFILSADQGAVDIWSTIDASGQGKGGTVEIYAQDDLTLQATGQILAQGEGTNGEGGTVLLASENGAVRTLGLSPEYGSGSLINVSGAAQWGEVTFRASRDVIRRNEMLLEGEIRGASNANAHAFRVYEDTSVTSTDVTQHMNDIRTEWPTLQTLWHYGAINLIPEVEVRSSGDLSLDSGLNNLNTLTAGMPNGTPGVFTFRAGRDLKVTSNIIDAPSTSLITGSTTKYFPISNGLRDSWDLNFVAGADLASSRLLDVLPPHDLVSIDNTSIIKGNFILGTEKNGKLLYTESGDINVAAGNDLIIHALPTSGSATAVPAMYMPGTNRYNLASFDGAIRGSAGNNLVLEGGIIQTAVSDITLQVRNDVKMNATSDKKGYAAIRTTGQASDVSALANYWDYRNGGNISLTAGGDVTGSVVDQSNTNSKNGWSYAYSATQFGAVYGENTLATHGIATMGGGSIAIKAKDIYSQIGTFGHGDLTVYARGDLDGRFLALDGDIHLTSLADFGNTADNATRKDTLVELGSGSLTIEALGNVSLGTICNPVLTSLVASLLKDSIWQLTYDEKSSATIHSALGDTVFSGKKEFGKLFGSSSSRYYLLPASLDITAGRDIRMNQEGTLPFILAPSADGQLSLVAGRDINGKKFPKTASYTNTNIFMSAADPEKVYGDQGTIYLDSKRDHILLKYGNTIPDPLHISNFTPAAIKAGRDLANMSFSLPKQADILADRDIRELGYWGQNLRGNDVSLISAGRNLIQQPYEGKNTTSSSSGVTMGIKQAGHGFLLVRASGNIDLGSSDGIQSTGSFIAESTENSALFKDSDKDEFSRYKGADVAVISGYALETSNEQIAAFFSTLRKKGDEYGALIETGTEEDKNAAARIKQDILDTLINPLLVGKKSGDGDITMTQSTIKTVSGQDNIYIIAAGDIDVGTTIVMDKDDFAKLSANEKFKLLSKGIQSESGGSINVFAENNINVNESRVASYFGGDILLLSNHADINAGRGSKTSVNSRKPDYTTVGGKRVKRSMAPAPGSGIRAQTADPDGAGPIGEPKQGDISLIAWEGVIDAGEAGIAGDNVRLAATKVLNSGNINFSDSGVGVPVTAEAGPSLGALAGASTVSSSQTTTQSMGQQVLDNEKTMAASMNKMTESLNMKMLVFKLEGFSEDLATPAQNNSDARGSVDEKI